MQVINLESWLLNDIKRIRRVLRITNRNKEKLIKRAEHSRRILAKFSSQNPNNYTFNLPTGKGVITDTHTTGTYNWINPYKDLQ